MKMNSLTANFKKSAPNHITFSIKPTTQSKDRSKKKITSKIQEEIHLDDLNNHSPPGTIRSNRFLLSNPTSPSNLTTHENHWDVNSSPNRQWCSVRAAIITFIIILIIILAVATAVGVVFGVLGGQLNGNGTRSNNPDNSFTTASGSGSAFTSSVIVGSQTGAACSAYTTINDPTRNVNKSGSMHFCDNGPLFNTSQGGAWIRFTGSGGSMIPMSPVGLNRCGSFLSGWTNGSLPTSSITRVNGTVCFETLAETCGFSVDILIEYCSPGVYAYFLPPLSLCSARYCTI